MKAIYTFIIIIQYIYFVFINQCFGFPQKLVHPTTGIIAVFVALNYCDVVHIAGFGYPVAKNQKHPIHYYGYDTMKSMKVSWIGKQYGKQFGDKSICLQQNQ